LKKPGIVRVIIGKPIPTVGKKPRELNDEIREAIEANLRRMDNQPPLGVAGQSSL
jgi:1-acyl-sn-glycerol-3-phosphate acyltransferase